MPLKRAPSQGRCFYLVIPAFLPACLLLADAPPFGTPADGSGDSAALTCGPSGEVALSEYPRADGESYDSYFGFALAVSRGSTSDTASPVVVGAPGWESDAGAVYLISSFHSRPPLTQARISGERGDLLGDSVAVVGSGAEAMVSVAAPGIGTVYLFDGTVSGELSTSSAAGTLAFDAYGIVVGNAGDIDDDGTDDIAVASPWTEAAQNGLVWLISGQARELTGDEVEITAAHDGQQVRFVGGGDDLSGDGLDDVVIGDPGAGANSAGAVYVVHGPIRNSASLDDADAKLTRENSAGSETAIAIPGDVDGDGQVELLIGNPGLDGESINAGGGAYLLRGPVNRSADLSDSAAILYGENSRKAGWSVAGGDMNGDGLADVAFGAPTSGATSYEFYGFSGPGSARLWFGPLSGTYDATTADLVLRGAESDDAAGFSVAIGSNDDGVTRLFLGAPGEPIDVANDGDLDRNVGSVFMVTCP